MLGSPINRLLPFVALIDTLERWHRLALVLVQRVGDDATVFNINIWRIHVVLPRQSMLHPVFVVTLLIAHIRTCCDDQYKEWPKMTHLGIILAGMSTARLFTRSRSSNGLNSVLEDVPEFKRLNQVPATLHYHKTPHTREEATRSKRTNSRSCCGP